MFEVPFGMIMEPSAFLEPCQQVLQHLPAASELSSFSDAECAVLPVSILDTLCEGKNSYIALYTDVERLGFLLSCSSAVAKGWQLVGQELRSTALEASAAEPFGRTDTCQAVLDSVMPGCEQVLRWTSLLSQLMVSLDKYAPAELRPQVVNTLAKQVTGSGLLEAMSSSCKILATAIDQYCQLSSSSSQQKQRPSTMRRGFLSAQPKQDQQQPATNQQSKTAASRSRPAYACLLASAASVLLYLQLAISIRPTEHLKDTAYAQTVLPVSELSAALLRARSALGADTGSSIMNGLVLQDLKGAINAIITLAHIFKSAATAVVPAGNHAAAFLKDRNKLRSMITDPATRQIVESPEFLRMLVVGLCTLTAGIHELNSGRSPHLKASSRVEGYKVKLGQQVQEQLEVPAYHEQCLAVLGLANFDLNHAACRQVSWRSLDVTAYIWATLYALLLQSPDSSSSSSSTGSQQRPALALELQSPLLLVVAELLAFCTDPGPVPAGLNLFGRLREMIVFGTASEADTPRQTASAAAAAIRAAAGPTGVADFLTVVVLYVTPVALWYVEQMASAPPAGAAAVAAASAQDTLEFLTSELHDLLILGDTLMDKDHPDSSVLAQLFKHKPLQTISVLEMLTRVIVAEGAGVLAAAAAAAAGTTPAARTSPVQLPQLLRAPRMLPLVRQALSIMCVVGPLEAAAAAQVLQPLPYAVSAMVSALKCIRLVHASASAHQIGMHWDLLAISANILLQAGITTDKHQQLLQSSSSNGKLHSSKRGVSALVPWIVLAGRSLIVLGEQLRDLAAGDAQYVPQKALLPPGFGVKVPLTFEAIREGVGGLQCQLDLCESTECLVIEAAGTAGLAALQDEADVVKKGTALAKVAFSNLLDNRRQNIGLQVGAAPVWDPLGRLHGLSLSGLQLSEGQAVGMLQSSLGDKLCQQLIDLGAAVCGAFPIPYCCNNPLCQTASKSSELELVGGKGCVCSGCEVARYCGRECQVAHWQGPFISILLLPVLRCM